VSIGLTPTTRPNSVASRVATKIRSAPALCTTLLVRIRRRSSPIAIANPTETCIAISAKAADCRNGRLGNFGSGHGFDNDRRRLSGLYRGRGSRLCSLSNTWRTGVRCLQHRDAMLKSPHPIAGIQRHHQSDDGDDRYCQDQKPNYDDFRHRSSPRMDESRQCYFAEKESDSGRTALWVKANRAGTGGLRLLHRRDR
jgi:hypothetical protein